MSEMYLRLASCPTNGFKKPLHRYSWSKSATGNSPPMWVGLGFI